MIDSLIVFAAQFAMVFLLGMQSRNVYHRNYIGSAVTSLLLGICGLYLTSQIALAAVGTGGRLVQIAFVASGPPAICLAIWIHPKLTGGRA